MEWSALPLFERESSPLDSRDVWSSTSSSPYYVSTPSCPASRHSSQASSDWGYTTEYDRQAWSSSSKSSSESSFALGSTQAQYVHHSRGVDIRRESTLDEDRMQYWLAEDDVDMEDVCTSNAASSASAFPATCPFPGCKSSLVFKTARDFRRHHNQHFKRFFCRQDGCPQSAPDPQAPGKTGFATSKDRVRHEAKHQPEIQCQWTDGHGQRCPRMFSRMDNMRDHIKRIHKRPG